VSPKKGTISFKCPYSLLMHCTEINELAVTENITVGSLSSVYSQLMTLTGRKFCKQL
jgi:hypothetical protein